jgi:nucleoside-diphosphate-sugar epimerase
MQCEEFDVAYDMICYGPGDAHSDLRAFDAVEHLIHTSTVCTFGGPFSQLPVTEETPLRPVMDYGKQKLLADEGRQFWSMCHSEDAANAYVGLMAQAGAIGETYILAGDEPTTWIAYHEEVADALRVRAQFVSAPAGAVIEAWPEATWLAPSDREDDVLRDLAPLLSEPIEAGYGLGSR